MDFLKRHPFAVEARFRKVVAVSFAFPEKVVASLLPAGLEVDSFEGFGFVTVALVWTESLRPAGFPKVLGQDFFLAGYRVFARLRDEEGRKMRGLKILRSETDKGRMVWLGNLMTGYNYRRVAVDVNESSEGTSVVCLSPDGTLSLDLSFGINGGEAGLPSGSPFPDWRTARRFAGPMPFTFSSESNGEFTVVEGKRGNWKPVPVEVKEWEVGLFSEAPFTGSQPVLANAFMVEDVEYRWEKGKRLKPRIDV